MPSAIDLYSGVGGWTLGLRMAEIESAASYEWWGQANETHRRNFSSDARDTDIRTMSFADLPLGVDYVVGSPPCTEFSYSNRGGNGDLAEGLKDVHRFLEIVEKLSPTYWVMENVPRVAGILEQELQPGGSLRRFRDLVDVIQVVNMSEFGLPQARKRMLAGSYPAATLDTYKSRAPRLTLGDVTTALGGNRIVDPIYGTKLPKSQLLDHQKEPPLDWEETRINHASKQCHPVYNKMAFPDRFDRPSRTVTALCTRVSRESIIIQDETHGLRRLTVRERASLQGFPITFQLYGRSYQSRIKMVGNAFPPIMAYYLASAMRGVSADHLLLPDEVRYQHPFPDQLPSVISVEGPGRMYSSRRKFEFAIPELHLGSGVRFQLANRVSDGLIDWKVAFFHGPSKSYKKVDLGGQLLRRIWPSRAIRRRLKTLQTLRVRFQRWVRKQVDSLRMQAMWTHEEKFDDGHPLHIIDKLGEFSRKLEEAFPATADQDVQDAVERVVESEDGPTRRNGVDKLRVFAKRILAGLLIGCWFNMALRPART